MTCCKKAAHYNKIESSTREKRNKDRKKENFRTNVFMGDYFPWQSPHQVLILLTSTHTHHLKINEATLTLPVPRWKGVKIRRDAAVFNPCQTQPREMLKGHVALDSSFLQNLKAQPQPLGTYHEGGVSRVCQWQRAAAPLIADNSCTGRHAGSCFIPYPLFRQAR